MVEPVSMAIGIIGFSLGVVGFVVTTVSKIEEKTREYQEYTARVSAHYLTLIVCQTDLDLWCTIWGGRQDAFYEHLWGQAGYIEVKTRQSEILRLAQEIENTLDLSDPALKAEREELFASGLDLLEWKSTLRALNPNIGPRANSSVSRRLGFLLYRNNILQERIARLKEMTAQLSSRTQRLLRLRRYPYVDKAPERGEIDNIIRLKKFVDGVSEHGNELYKATQEESKALRWALALRIPDKDGDPELWAQVSDITAQFSVRFRTSDDQTAPCVVSIRHFIDEPVTESDLEAEVVKVVLADLTTGSRRSNTPAAFSYDSLPNARTRPLKNYFLQPTLAARSSSSFYHHKKLRIALGLANWIILYWNTKWTERLCSCKIRILKYDDKGDQPILDPRARHVAACQRYDQDECRVGEKLLLLGVTLAEIALLAPINIDGREPEANNLKFILRNEQISLARLQVEIRDIVGFKGLLRAIQFCFETWSQLTQFGPELIKLFTEEVLAP